MISKELENSDNITFKKTTTKSQNGESESSRKNLNIPSYVSNLKFQPNIKPINSKQEQKFMRQYIYVNQDQKRGNSNSGYSVSVQSQSRLTDVLSENPNQIISRRQSKGSRIPSDNNRVTSGNHSHKNNLEMHRSSSLKTNTYRTKQQSPSYNIINNQTINANNHRNLDTRMSLTPAFKHLAHTTSYTYNNMNDNQGYDSGKYTNDYSNTPAILTDVQSAKYQNIRSNVPNTNMATSNSQILSKSMDRSQICSSNQGRKFRIFTQPAPIKFQIPPLEQYYYKNIKNQSEMGQNNQKNNFAATNNLNMSYGGGQSSVSKPLNNSIMDFRYSQKLFKKNTNLDNSKNMDSTQSNFFPSVNRANKMSFKPSFEKPHDQIKEQGSQEEDMTSSIKNEKQITQQDKIKQKMKNQRNFVYNLKNFSDNKIKGIYMLLGFFVSIIFMVVLKNFI